MLYEVSEAINMESNGLVFKSSEATLSGAIKPGTPLCRLGDGTDSCWVIVHATRGADDALGVGPIRGTMFVLEERLNPADAPEIKILSADFDGQLDLSPAFLQRIPRGTIVGKYSARGEKNSIMDGYKVQGSFQGVFRLPFLNGPQASYLLDDGSDRAPGAQRVLGRPADAAPRADVHQHKIDEEMKGLVIEDEPLIRLAAVVEPAGAAQ